MPKVASAMVLAGLLLAALPAQAGGGALARPNRLGLGLGGSNLTNGITGKLYLSADRAVQVAVGWWFPHGPSIAGDYLFEQPSLVDQKDFTLHWYVGVGAGVGFFGNDASIGAAGIGGLAFHLKPVPVEITIELRPTVAIPGYIGWLHIGGGGAVRYYF